ncbi:MAG: hypothetical protein LAO06_00675 [Acidobacteriia bacterium]|nr:hypothetical protein [Terriglobia bacterium]
MHRKARALIAAICCAVLLALLPRAVTQVSGTVSRYKEQRTAIRDACGAERKRLGLTPDKARAKYPTTEVSWTRPETTPGASVEFVSKGKFVPGTKVLVQSDNVEVVKEVVAADAYRATFHVLPSAGPGLVFVVAYNPVSCLANIVGDIDIGGRFVWDLTANNGLLLKLKTLDKPITRHNRDVKHQLEFYRPGQSRPFQVLETAIDGEQRWYGGTLFSPGSDPEEDCRSFEFVSDQAGVYTVDLSCRSAKITATGTVRFAGL